MRYLYSEYAGAAVVEIAEKMSNIKESSADSRVVSYGHDDMDRFE